MPTIVQTVQGRVTGLWGSAIIKGADGHTRTLRMGDLVVRGDVILTTQDGIVQLTSDPAAVAAVPASVADTVPTPTAVKPAPGNDVDRVIGELDQNDPDAATAAGLTGGDGGEFRPGLRVDRIVEPLTPLGLGANDDSTTPRPEIDGTFQGSDPLQTNTAPVAQGAAIDIDPDATLPVPLVGTDGDGSVASVTVTAIPPGSTLLLADGVTVVQPGQTLTPQQAAGVLFRPGPDFDGQSGITFFVTDNQGLTSESATVSFNLIDINPPPVNHAPAAADDSATVGEDSTATGNLLGNDSDADGDPLGVTQFTIGGTTYAAGSTASLPGAGSLTINPNGSYSFTPVANYNGPVPVATYTVSDGKATSTATLTLTLNPASDPPVAAPDTIAATEDQPVVFDPRRNDSDADGDLLEITAVAGQPIAVGAPVTLPQGTVALNADGSLTFTPNPNFNGPVVFPYTISDGTSTSTSQVTVDVSPVNDPPVAANDLASTPVNVPITIAVLANDSDIDGDPLSVSGAVLADPVLGTVSVNPNGTLAFTPATNVTGPVVVNYTISDGRGGTATASVTVNVGPNTPPAGTDAAVSIAEDGSRSFAAADFGFSDADAGQTFANVRIDAPPLAGSLALNGVPVSAGQVIAVADLGALVFTPAPNANGAGYANFTFSVQDSSGAFDTVPNRITVDVTALPDAAVIGGQATGATVEDTTLTTGGTLTVSDPDAGEAAFNPRTNVAGAHGTFSIDAAGVWTYALNNADPAVQALGAGQSLPSETFTVSSIDGSSSTVTVSITGTNDAAAISSGVGTVTEDVTLTTGGTLTVTDIDGSASFVAQPATAGTYGSFTLDAAGDWGYTLANALPAVQALGAGQTLTETFAVSSADGTSSSVTVTIIGTDDAPLISADSGAVVENTQPSIGGTLTATDVDNPALAFTAGTTSGNYGALVLAANGTWTYTLDNRAEPLAQGQTVGETITVTLNDGSTTTVTISITGTNDAAVIGGAATGSVTEDGVASANGTLTVSDIDSPATFVAASAAGTYGNFTVDAAGAWTYTLRNGDANVQALTSAQHPVESFTVTSADGTTSTVTVTVNGANEPPVAVVTPASGSEDAVGIPVQLGGSDIDGSIASFTVGSLPANGVLFFGGVAVTIGQVIAATAGSAALSFVPDANWNGSTAFDFTTTDNEGAVSPSATVPISVLAVNDPPVADNDIASTPINTPLASIVVLANDSDIDGDPLSVSGAVLADPALGTVSVNPNGTLAFTPATNVTGPVVVNYTISDGRGGTATASVTVNVGPNTPPAGTDATVSIAEDGSRSFAAADFGFSDADAGQTFANVRIDAPPLAGSLALNGVPVSAGQVIAVADLGALVFTPAPNANGAGYANFTFSVQDSSGAFDTVPNRITVDVTALPDAAVIGGQATGATVEDTTLTTGGTLTVSDPDAGEAAFNPRTNVAGAHGTFSIDAAGVWTYALNNADPAVQALGAGQSLPSEIFTVSSIDGSSSTVTVSITGTNDNPVARNDEGSVTAAQTRAVSAADGIVLSTAVSAGRDTDVDGDALTVTQVVTGAGAPNVVVSAGGVTIAGAYGDLLLRSDGSYSYSANRADAVATGTQVNDVFTYQVSDGHGGLASASLTLHVIGVADTLNAPPPTTTALTAPLGLNGEFYGYNDFNPTASSANRRHSDDGTLGNLDHVTDIDAIVNGRNAVFGGGSIVGSTTAARDNTADARFIARTIDYGTSPEVSGTLGSNPNIAAGGSTAGLNNTSSQLYKFLNRTGGNDAASLVVRQGTGDNDAIGTGPTSGLGRTSDAAIRITGQAYLDAGLYDIRVRADDGFRLRLDDQTVAIFDNIQSPTTRVYSGVPIEGGLTPLELIYWEQGGNAVLRVEFKLSGSPDTAYQLLGSQAAPLFTDANAPVLLDTQDLIAGPTAGSYLVRTGSVLDGGNGDDILTGSAARDVLIGGAGRDTLNGGAGDDLIRGGSGNDQLTGGVGHDVFRWSLGDAGATGAPARDVIRDFDNTNHAGDVLDFRDLLVGESHAVNTLTLPATIGTNNAATVTPHEGNLANYLHFSAVAGDTVVEISSTGGFSGSYNPAAVDQVITLSGLNLVGGFSNDHQVINDLLQRGKLVTD